MPPVIETSAPSPLNRRARITTARVIDNGSNSVTINAVAQQPGYLILDDSAYPGWSTYLDGRSVDWKPANENFRAVALPAGRHVVRFRYRPTSILLGAVISTVSALVLLMLAAVGIRRSHFRRAR